MEKSYIDIIRAMWSSQRPIPSFADEMSTSMSVEKYAESRNQKAACLKRIMTEVAPGPHEDPNEVQRALEQLVHEIFIPEFFDYKFPGWEEASQQFGKSWESTLAPFCKVRDFIVNDLHNEIDKLVYAHKSAVRSKGERSRKNSRAARGRTNKRNERNDIVWATWLNIEPAGERETKRDRAARVQAKIKESNGIELHERTIRGIVARMEKAGRRQRSETAPQ